jgi:hypothetical protein
VEADAARHARALKRSPSFDLHAGDIFDPAARWARSRVDVTLLMPGRLLEVDAPRANRLRAWLRDNGGRIVAYAYGDWLQRFGSLEALCTHAGLQVTGHVCSVSGVVSVADAAVPRSG